MTPFHDGNCRAVAFLNGMKWIRVSHEIKVQARI